MTSLNHPQNINLCAHTMSKLLTIRTIEYVANEIKKEKKRNNSNILKF